MADHCNIPPVGWRCTRAAGHDGPCAAVPDGPARGAWAASIPASALWLLIGALVWWARS